MSRSLPQSVAVDLERSSAPDALIWFLTIRHGNLRDPIRVVSDVFDYLVDGDLYTGILFDAQPLTDTDQAPAAQLRVPNVDRRIGQALQDATGRATVEAVARTTADFDLSLDPREPVGTPATIYSFAHFDLVDVEVNAAEITGRLMLADYTQEPWPATRATADRCPGLFA